MSQKRKHAETADSSSSAPKPFKKHRAFKPGKSHQKQKRPQVSDDVDGSTSTNALKSRIRDLKRLLVHVDSVGDHKMSAGNRVERERELAACEHELKEKIESNREAAYKQKMIGKYHQVRFFDRQKATRIHKRLQKEHAAEQDSSKRAELRQRLHNAEVDLNYAIYYPLMKPYSSLYPKSKKEKTTESEEAEGEDGDKANREVEGPKGDVEMWKAIEDAMPDEGALKTLRYSKENMPAPAPKKDKKKQKTTDQSSKIKEAKIQQKLAAAKNRRERRALGVQVQEEEDESDGGFFE